MAGNLSSIEQIIGGCYLYRFGPFRILDSGLSMISTDFLMNYVLAKKDRPSKSFCLMCTVYYNSLQTDGYIQLSQTGELNLFFYKDGKSVAVTEENKDSTYFFFNCVWCV